MSGSPVLSVEDLVSGYGDVQVLYDLSLELGSDEIVCMVGPNGAGKSTVLLAVFGLLEPWSGRVSLRGEDITGRPPEAIVRTGVGYVPQTENVFGSLTVEENLRMGGVSRDGGVEATVADLYDRFPLLAEKQSSRARQLSGGQRQVLAFARALMTDPEVLLIDEPSAGLAPNTAEDVFDRVEAVNDAGAAVLMIEQNARAGLGIADRGYVLDQGRVRFEGEADELLEDPEVAELYLGG
jgi:branched-chain amino acid transport system ATP-binding protein